MLPAWLLYSKCGSHFVFTAYIKVRLLKKLSLKLSFQLIFLHETVELSAVLWKNIKDI